MILIIWAIILAQISRIDSYSFSEELLVESLPNLNVHFNFQFKSVSNQSTNQLNLQNYGLFPKQFGDIMTKFKIDELSLKLSQGTWKYNEWGLPVLSAPTGSELWAVFSNEVSDELVDSYWLQSSRAISGIFGLSINLLDNPNTASPIYSIQTSKVSNKLRYASIPNEIVCTENLTPWIKLLPCGKTKGIAQLLKNPNKLFESQYLSTGLHFKKECINSQNCLQNTLELKQTLSLVYNSELILKQKEKTMWTFQELFAQKIDMFCPVADISNIYTDLGIDGTLNLKPTERIFSKSAKKEINVFDLKKILKETTEFNPTVILKKGSFQLEPLIEIHRYIANTNERNFHVKTLIKNKHNEKLSIIYFDTLSWYFRVFLNSLVIRKNDEIANIRPGLDRSRPHHIELVLELEPNSNYLISFNVESSFLKWDEFPPDTNHGFYINPALISIKPNMKTLDWPQLRSFVSNTTIYESLNENYSKNHRLINIYTETLLMNVPLPDFSMPYNVICLVSTVVAIAFGSLHNFTTKKFKFLEPKTFKEKVLDFLGKIFKRKQN